MRKIFYPLFLLILSFSLVPQISIASGTIEMVDFSESYTAVAAENFRAHFSFYYSGTIYTPKVTLTSKNFPTGLKMGKVTTEGVSFYSVEYSGIPEVPGSYSLKLLVTDDYGAMLVRDFVINVKGLTFDTTSLPDVTVGQESVNNINFHYPGTEVPRLSFEGFPQSFYLQKFDPNGFNSHFVLSFLPTKAGEYTFNIIAKVNGFRMGVGALKINVLEKKVSSQLSIPQPEVSQNPPLAEDVVVVQKPVVVGSKVATTQQGDVTQKPKTIVEKKQIEDANEKTVSEGLTSATMIQFSSSTLKETVKATITPVVQERQKPLWSRLLNWFMFWKR